MALIILGQTFNGTAGTDDFPGSAGNDVFNMTADRWITDYINGGFGRDTVDYTWSLGSAPRANPTAVNITLTDGVNGGPSGGTVTAQYSDSFVLNGVTQTITHDQIVAELTSIENATGSRFNDVLNGNSVNNVLKGGLGDDVINGGGGTDWITGGRGRDVLTGGADGDVFVFDGYLNGVIDGVAGQTYDSAVSLSSADVITDFEQGRDRIDLRGIDADVINDIIPSRDSAFTFIGRSEFTGQAGELHEVIVGDTRAVQGDVDGDAVADFSIVVQGLDPRGGLIVSDFFL